MSVEESKVECIFHAVMEEHSAAERAACLKRRLAPCHCPPGGGVPPHVASSSIIASS